MPFRLPSLHRLALPGRSPEGRVGGIWGRKIRQVLPAPDAGGPAGGSEGISIAPALDTAAAVIMLALPCEWLPAPKSLKRIAA
jgi:hypothetical protein